MTTLLTEDEILARKQALLEAAHARSDERASASRARTEPYRYVKPFSDSYAGVLEAIENPDQRFQLGLREVDMLTRGFGPKELVLITGFSHAGKTQLVNTAILNNRERRILFFSMDDPSEMILLKLTCMSAGVDAETLEKRIRSHDDEAKLKLRQVATDVFRNLIVVDESLGLGGMNKAVHEATDLWGAPPEAVILDYVGSMQGNGHDDDESGGIKGKVAALKRWIKDQPFPLIALHQNTRGRGAPGAPITLMSGAYGGEQEATILLGVRRKRDDEDLDQPIRDTHKNTLTIHVVKNKRPPSKVTPSGGVDFFMDPTTGLIRTLREDDMPRLSQPVTTVKDAYGITRQVHQDPLTEGGDEIAKALGMTA